MHSADPAIMLICDLPDQFHLHDFLKRISSDTDAPNDVIVNDNKFPDFDITEILMDGMAFIVSHHSAEILREQFLLDQSEKIFCTNQSDISQAIGISLGQNIASAKHVATVNRALLQLASIVGSAAQAKSVLWVPAGINIGFDFFHENALQYCAGGPFPVLIQIRIDEGTPGNAHTTGLGYFAEQEIWLEGPADYPQNEIIKRLVRLSHDVATNGKIDTSIDTNGSLPGETISLRPSDDLKILNVTIKNGAKVLLH